MSPPGMRYGYEIELARDEWLMWMDMSAARSEMSAIAGMISQRMMETRKPV